MTTKKRSDHIIQVPPMTFVCLHCGVDYEVNMPAPIDIVLGAMKSFSASHRACKLDKTRGIACAYCFAFGHAKDDCPRLVYKGDFRKWLEGPDTGTSSRMICRTLKPEDDLTPTDVNASFGTIPLDPSDFGRCHRLLHAIPGWRARIGEMRTVPGWAPLVDAWDELEALYLDELRGLDVEELHGDTPPNRSKQPSRLYLRMRELIDGAGRKERRA